MENTFNDSDSDGLENQSDSENFVNKASSGEEYSISENEFSGKNESSGDSETLEKNESEKVDNETTGDNEKPLGQTVKLEPKDESKNRFPKTSQDSLLTKKEALPKPARERIRSMSQISGLASDYDESEESIYKRSEESPGLAKNDSPYRSPSPSPPREIVWESPPSPFLTATYAPKRFKTKPPKPKKHFEEKQQQKVSFLSRFSAPNPHGRSAAAPLKDITSHAREYRPRDLNDAEKKMALTNSEALRSLSSVTSSEYFDPEIELMKGGAQIRKPRQLRLVRPGTFERKAHVLRAKMLTLEMEQENQIVKEDQGEEDLEFGFFEDKIDEIETKIAAKTDAKNGKELGNCVKSESETKPEDFKEPKPESFLEKIEKKRNSAVEWWDNDLLKTADYSYGEENYIHEMITNYIQTPLPVQPVLRQTNADPVPLFLTDREKKKAKRMKKRARLEVQAERVRLGLEPPPDAKVSLANVMRVLGNAAVRDPSAVEREVRAKVEKRRVAHLLHNELRKLTPAERRQKKRAKLREDKELAKGVIVSVFKLGSLGDARARFKLDVTASQLGLTGCAISGQNFSMVVVEGGPKGILKFKRMVGSRIEWDKEVNLKGAEGDFDENLDENADSDDEGVLGSVCVWDGVVQKRSFQAFGIEIAKSEAVARKFFSKHRSLHYWDITKASQSENDVVVSLVKS